MRISPLADAVFLYHEVIRGFRADNIFIYPHGTPSSTTRVNDQNHGGANDDGAGEDIDVDDDGGDDGDGRVYVHELFDCLWTHCPTEPAKYNMVRNVLLALPR